MSSAAWPLQQAVYTALSAALSVPVYDDVPADAGEPYVAIGEDAAVADGTKTSNDERHTLTIHVWSTYRGKKEVKEIMAQVVAALHDQPLTVAGFRLVRLFHVMSEDFLDADGLTRHGVVTMRAIVSP